MDARPPGARTQDQPPHSAELNPDQARQAVKTGFMRRVLGVSVGLAVIALIAAWLWNDRPKPARTTAPAAAAAPQAPLLPRDQQRATTPATPAAPQSSQPLP